jgi:hypothetical protein
VGRELGPDALDAYTEVKNVFYATDEASPGQGAPQHEEE